MLESDRERTVAAGLLHGLDSFIDVVGLITLVTVITMSASRCCAPCCCGPQMPDVDPPCPQKCDSSNLHLLDYPFYIAMIGETSGIIAILLLELSFMEYMPGLRAIFFAWSICAFVGAFTGFRKFRILQEKYATRSTQTPAGATPTATPGVMVVGAPVTVPGKVVS